MDSWVGHSQWGPVQHMTMQASHIPRGPRSHRRGMKGMVKGGETDGAACSEAGGDFSRISHERREEEEKKSREIWGQGVFKYSSWEGGLLRGCLWAVSPELLTGKERRKEGRSAVTEHRLARRLLSGQWQWQ